MSLFVFALLLFQGPVVSSPPKQPECPMHEAHMKDQALNDRGEKAMGFAQEATTHHFLMTQSGGVIQVTANNPSDTAGRDMVRTHLQHIAKEFENGNFDIPMLVHDTVPPGVPEMKRLRAKITYVYENTPTGGGVVITTRDKDAKAAVYQFLRFQIEEHKTGDPIEMK